MINTLYGKTTFSGSDITVVAYRNSRTPAERFAIEEQEKELAEEIAYKKKLEIDELTRMIEVTSRDGGALGSLDSKNFRSMQPKALKAPGALGEEGKYQNEVGSLETDKKFLQIQKASRATDQRINDIKKNLKKRNELSYVKFDNIHTVSYSSFREKFAVRSLGRTHAKGYTRGPRTIAGTMVFNTMQEQALMGLTNKEYVLDKDNAPHPNAISVDQIEPFNFLFVFANEYGAYSVMHLFGIEISSEGQEMSIDNLLTQNTFNFYATDLVPMQNIGNLFGSYNDMIIDEIKNNDGPSGVHSNQAELKQKHAPDIFFNNPFNQKNGLIGQMLSDSRGLL